MQRKIRFRAWHNGMKKMFGADEMSRDQMALLPDGRFCNVSGADPSLSTFPDISMIQNLFLLVGQLIRSLKQNLGLIINVK